MFVRLPLIEDVVAFLGRADGVEHVAVALAVYALLEGLDVKTEVHLVGRDVLADGGEVVALERVKEDEEREDFVVGRAFGAVEQRIVLRVLS